MAKNGYSFETYCTLDVTISHQFQLSAGPAQAFDVKAEEVFDDLRRFHIMPSTISFGKQANFSPLPPHFQISKGMNE